MPTTPWRTLGPLDTGTNTVSASLSARTVTTLAGGRYLTLALPAEWLTEAADAPADSLDDDGDLIVTVDVSRNLSDLELLRDAIDGLLGQARHTAPF